MLSNSETIERNSTKICPVLFDLLKLHKAQIKLSKPKIPEDTRIVRKLELKAVLE